MLGVEDVEQSFRAGVSNDGGFKIRTDRDIKTWSRTSWSFAKGLPIAAFFAARRLLRLSARTVINVGGRGVPAERDLDHTRRRRPTNVRF